MPGPQSGLIEILVAPLGIRMPDGHGRDAVVRLIPAGTPYPLAEPARMRVQPDPAGRLRLEVYEGIDFVGTDYTAIGVVDYRLPDGIDPKTPVEIGFNYDRHRQVVVTVTVPGTSVTTTTALRRDRPSRSAATVPAGPLLRDPLTVWDGPFPYDVLARVGVTPGSSMKEITDASYDLMTANEMSPAAREAWDQLRIPARRLFVDFFLYDIDLREALTRGSAELAQAAEVLPPPPDLSAWLRLDEGGLEASERPVGERLADAIDRDDGAEFEWRVPPLPADIVEFDR